MLLLLLSLVPRVWWWLVGVVAGLFFWVSGVEKRGRV